MASCRVFLLNNVEHRLKFLCRVIQFFSTASLVLLFIYVYYSKLLDKLQLNKIKWSTVGFRTAKQNITCLDDTFSTSDGCVPCPNGSFSFPGWSKCVPFLNCSEIAHQVYLKQRIQGGWTKEIWLADWKGHEVVHLKCRNGARVKTRCLRGMSRMEMLQGPFVTRLIGTCYNRLQIVTKYYKHGSLSSLDRLLQQPSLSHYNNIQTRLRLCVDYVKIMDYLHNSPIGTRVMCDTATLDKLLTQYLITDDFHLVVNDLDNTPEATDEEGILCHERKELRPFVAPEQRCPNKSAPFILDNMPPYDEKVDIWKIPAVVERLIGNVNGSSLVKRKLEQVMKRCHATNPEGRPTAKEILQEFLMVQGLFKSTQ